jgi:hypothetical protein
MYEPELGGYQTFERKPASEHIYGLQWGKKKNGEKILVTIPAIDKLRIP